MVKISYQLVICSVVLWGILLLSGCGNVPQTESAAGAQATLTLAESTISPSQTPLPPPADSATPTHTALPAPSITTDLTLVASQTNYAPTQAAEETLISLTEEAQATLNASFPITCDDSYTIDRFSPDQAWKVLRKVKKCKGESVPMMIVENKSGVTWKLKYEDFLGAEAKEHGIAVSASLYPLHWSPDGHYLYFTSYGGAEGGGTCFYGFGDEGMFRLDLQTGKVSTILSIAPSGEWNGYEIAFSPNGRRFSYSRVYMEGKNSFHLVDVLTGEETTFPTEEQNGTFIWSPDGKSLAYSTSLCDFKATKVIHSFIKILTISDLSTRTIAQSDTDFLTIQGWSAEDNLLTIERESYGDGANQPTTLSVDPNKRIVISSAPPTP